MLRKVTGTTQGVVINKTVIDRDTKIIGNIVARDIDILGTIEGNITSSGLVYADKEAVITGDIEFGSILVEEGAVLKGTFKASEKGYLGGVDTGGIKIKWGKDLNPTSEAKLRLKNLMDRLGQ